MTLPRRTSSPTSPTLAGPRCAVLDDNDMSRLAICLKLEQFGLPVVAQFSTARSMLDWFQPGVADVAVLDLSLGGQQTGADVAVALRRRNPRVGIVVLTVCQDPRLIGVDPNQFPTGTRYVIKDDIVGTDALLRAVREAHVRSTRRRNPGFDIPSAGVSDPAVEVLRMVAEGYSNAEIAKRRHVTLAAVERAITRLYAYFGVSSESSTSSRVALARIYWSLRGQGNFRDRGGVPDQPL